MTFLEKVLNFQGFLLSKSMQLYYSLAKCLIKGSLSFFWFIFIRDVIIFVVAKSLCPANFMISSSVKSFDFTSLYMLEVMI